MRESGVPLFFLCPGFEQGAQVLHCFKVSDFQAVEGRTGFKASVCAFAPSPEPTNTLDSPARTPALSGSQKNRFFLIFDLT